MTPLNKLATLLPAPKRNRTFWIPKGKHRSRPLLFIDAEKARGIQFETVVKTSWYFDPPKKNGWAKLFGISAGWNAHKNSARWVFRNTGPGTLHLGIYCYFKGTSPQQNTELKKLIKEVYIGEKLNLSIFRLHASWVFSVDGIMVYKMPCGDMKSPLFVYKPYMGGTYTIEHDFYATIHYRWAK